MLILEGRRTWREIADELLETQRVEFLDEGGLIFVPPAGFTHLTIVRLLVRCFNLAPVPDGHTGPWETAEGLQWELGDASRRYSIPDLAVALPGGMSRADFLANIALLVEVTSPKSPNTVENDKGKKPKQYAKAGVPFYLLVDQKAETWTLHQLIDGWPKYEVHSTGQYGEFGDPIDLPAPFNFAIPTTGWPPYVEGEE